MTTSERSDSRRRWAIAASASVLLHLSLLVWWRGLDLAPGNGPAGSAGAGGIGGMGSGMSVIEVSIDVDAPVAAGAVVPAEDIAVDATPIPPANEPEPTTTPLARVDSVATTATTNTETATGSPSSGMGGNLGGGSGSGGSGSATGSGTGDGGVPGGVGARTGGSGDGIGGGTVPPRPIEITWPDTRKLSHCVGLRVDVRIRVDAEGRVEKVEPASTGLPEDCVRAALETARRIKFAPGTVAGKPATLWSLVTIDFEKKK